MRDNCGETAVERQMWLESCRETAKERQLWRADCKEKCCGESAVERHVERKREI